MNVKHCISCGFVVLVIAASGVKTWESVCDACEDASTVAETIGEFATAANSTAATENVTVQRFSDTQRTSSLSY